MNVVFPIIFTAAGYLIGIALIPRILLQRRESGATLAWVLAIIFFPYIGILLFWALGTQRMRWARRRRQRAERAIAPAIAEATKAMRRFEAKAEVSQVQALEEPGRSLAMLADNLGTPSCGGNQIELLADAKATFSRIESAIASAESHVHLEYYIWRADETGTRLRDLLVKTAARGVEVRVLIDDSGSREANARFWRPLVAAGGAVARSLPVVFIAKRFALNNRNHRKIVVTDGRVAFTGGLNVGDEYFGLTHNGPWRDTHVRLEGPAVARLQEIFVEDWFHATEQDLTAPRYFPDPVPAGDQRVHILASGPDDGRAHAIEMIHFAAITRAERRVWLTTPYFVPDPALNMALESAALRGVDVRLLLPGKNDQPIVQYAARSFYLELLEAGVGIYEYGADTTLHSKTATVDGCWATVGSANLDRRSFRLNFEANAVAYGHLLARQLERAFERDLARARPVVLADFRRRPLIQRTFEGLARVLSPLL
jgi:cardiolipin synthase